jgi:hypothetical protein
MPTKQLVEIIADLANKYQIQPKEVRAIYDKAVKEKEENPKQYTIQYVRKHYNEKPQDMFSQFEMEEN